MQENNSHRIRHHVQLPGGRQIEVVYLDSRDDERPVDLPASTVAGQAAERRAETSTPPLAHEASKSGTVRSDTPVAATPWTGDSPTRAPGEALHVCRGCAGGLVHPLDWLEESPGRWRVLLRCPDCDELRDGVFGQALVERLDDELDRATGALLSDLRQITHANMVEEIERFTRALELDLIGPADF
ncbi:MAG TPA: hypothetical protein VGI26_09220 [Solirubrobacteraceae bacterium]